MQQNHACMRGLSVCLGVIAILQALVTAPLFHSHDRDDHGHSTSVVHAHLVEEAEHDNHAEPEYDSSDTHHGRPIDVYVLSMPLAGFDLAIDSEATFLVPVPVEQAGVVMLAAPRAHGPPEVPRSSPRSPPSIA